MVQRKISSALTLRVRVKLLPNESEKKFVNGEQQDFLNGNQAAKARAAELAAERDGHLPVWVRAPKYGHEFYSGCSRAKLYEWAGKGFIRSVSIREPGRIKGVRLFHLASILAFIERCEFSAQSGQVGTVNTSCPELLNSA